MSQINESKHFTFHVSDGENFVQTSHMGLWGVKSRQCKKILDELKPGDILWFMEYPEKGSHKRGKIMAVAVFQSKNERIIGSIFSLTPTNEELGWKGRHGGQSDTEIHYTNLYNLRGCDLYTGLQRGNVICRYDNLNKEKMLLNLPELYNTIVRFSQITNSM